MRVLDKQRWVLASSPRARDGPVAADGRLVRRDGLRVHAALAAPEHQAPRSVAGGQHRVRAVHRDAHHGHLAHAMQDCI